MSAFTEFQQPDGTVETYASTNKYMRFAIEVMDAGYSPIINSRVCNVLPPLYFGGENSVDDFSAS